MEVKLFEVRDRGTYMPSLAIRCNPANESERLMLWRAGYGEIGWVQGSYVLFAPESDPRLRYNPSEWGCRTRATAHQYIKDHWSELTTGQVIDVRTILGETDAPAPSDNAHAKD